MNNLTLNDTYSICALTQTQCSLCKIVTHNSGDGEVRFKCFLHKKCEVFIFIFARILQNTSIELQLPRDIVDWKIPVVYRLHCVLTFIVYHLVIKFLEYKKFLFIINHLYTNTSYVALNDKAKNLAKKVFCETHDLIAMQ